MWSAGEPFGILSEQDCPDEARAGGVVGEDDDDLRWPLRFALEPFDWLGLCSFARCSLGNVVLGR